MNTFLTTQKTDFEEKFDLSRANIKKKNTLHSYNDQISAIYAETENFGRIYYKTLDFISKNELLRIREAYRAGCRLEINAPFHAFSDSWVAIKHFEGINLNRCSLKTKKKINTDTLFNQLTKCYIMGYSDCGSDNLLINSEGKFAHIDLGRHILSTKIIQQIEKSIKHIFNNLDIHPNCLEIIKGMATNRARKIKGNQTLNTFPEIIRKNIKQLMSN